jgi:hypothetical protein
MDGVRRNNPQPSSRKGVTKNISGVQTEELKKNIEVLNAITKALKAAQKLTAKVVLPSLRK